MSLDDELKANGMLTVDELISGQPIDGFVANAGVVNLSTFVEWLDMRTKEMLTIKARMLLDKNDENDLFEWVLAHSAAFNEVRVNLKKAMKS